MGNTLDDTDAMQESIATTLRRNLVLAGIAGAVASRWLGVSRWPLLTLVMLWPALGGHYVEIAYLSWVQPRLPASRSVRAMARIAVWLIAGAILALTMRLTAGLLINPRAFSWLQWWIGAVVFVGIEFIAHAALYSRGRPSFFGVRLPAS